ncbi:hypothetical protein QYE76_013268 [Lolium multiflorum]|uniref:Phytocyanin domain-containing protein n=1 Tax=Lolium multiflorum TaxID=4521 RepID=A0AAD8X4P2_LOLMU|nr:hypothetical protein QYE76_013268 [Lolium multiflorum]
MLLLCLSPTVVCAKEWIVGDDKGWSLGVSGWEKGKNFSSGDVLVFNYDPKMHNVLEVSTGEYESCKFIGVPSRRYNSGHDRIQLLGTLASYVCETPVHCDRGMKIHIPIQN